MRCHRAQTLMVRQVRELLPPREREWLERHRRQCERCRQEGEELGGYATLLTASRRPATATTSSTPPSAATLIRRAEARSQSGLLGGLGLPHPRRWALPAAGALAAAAGIGYVVSTTRPPLQHAEAVRPQPGPTTTPKHSAPKPPVQRRLAPLPIADTRLPRPIPTSTAVPIPDEEYLDGRDPHLVAEWMAGRQEDPELLTWLQRRLPTMQDDFVQVPFPRFAAADPKSPAVGEAIRKYEEEAKVVDPRLFKKVTLHLKGASLEDLCAELGKQLGVRFAASRGVQDDKATVLVKDRPARDVLREVARLFGYIWSRSGEEGKYRYELVQDLRSQLAEQEMRDRDLRAALVALDEQMQGYQSVLGLTPEQIEARRAKSNGPEQERLARVSGPQWAGMQAYLRLTPAERAGLVHGTPLRFGGSQADANHRLPEEWSTLLSPFFSPSGTRQPSFSVAGLEVKLQINRSELGQLTLETEAMALLQGQGVPPVIGIPGVLATASSPSVAKPNNAARNAALQKDPLFQRLVSLRPETSCRTQKAAEEASKRGEPQPAPQAELLRYAQAGLAMTPEKYARLNQNRAPHVTSADLWEAVHEQTGLPVVADYYSLAYPQSAVTARGSLFEVLGKVGDELRVRWKKDGDFLLCRSTSYFWDRQKEVPNRLLLRCVADRERPGGLPLGDLLELAQLSDDQLDSETVGNVVTHCWNVPEWDLLQKPGGWLSARPWARLIGSLPPGQVNEVFSAEGVPVRSLTPESRRAVVALMERFPVADLAPNSVAAWKLRADYAPAGSYVWGPAVGPQRNPLELDRLPLVTAATAAEALQKAHRIDPAASPEEIMKTEGVFYITLVLPDGRSQRVAGERPMRVQVNPSP